ncbi:hypothetical protein [Wolbachia endosymbiont (group A) of Brachyopa scutellaris]|uniref:hypothetical protein n=1 Tax=Wolbachia endosymbiont (group A) of Brachyopa scutellaris TaxID=3066140 RepID=UPI003132BE6D
MADLFEVAKARNKDEFVRICTENVAYAAKHRLDENGNPFHIAASQEILLPALKEIMRNLEEGTKSKVKKAEEAKNWKESERLKEKLKDIRDILKKHSAIKAAFFMGE